MRFISIISLAVILCAQTSVAQEKFRIGIIHPLSGALAEYGVATSNAFKLAQETDPSVNKNIEFVFEDNAGDNTKTVSAFTKLTTFNPVDLVFVWGFGPVQAVAPIAESQHVPLIAISAERSISVGRKYVIRFNFYAEQIGEALAAHFRKQGAKKYGIIKTEQAFLNAIADGFASSLMPGETVETLDNYMLQDQDFMPSILKARQRKYDALGVLLWPGQISRFYRQLAAIGGGLATFGPHTFESYTEMKDAGGAMEGAVFAAMSVTDDFSQRYIKRFGGDNRISFAANAYDFATLSASLFGPGSKDLSPEQILAKYRGVSKYSGAGGDIHYVDTKTEGPSFLFPIRVRQIGRDKMVDVP